MKPRTFLAALFVVAILTGLAAVIFHDPKVEAAAAEQQRQADAAVGAQY
jgi:hypothetical protein